MTEIDRDFEDIVHGSMHKDFERRYTPQHPAPAMTDIETIAKEKHVPTECGEFMIDWVECSCGWKSETFFDGMPYAKDAHRKHIRDYLKQQEERDDG